MASHGTPRSYLGSCNRVLPATRYPAPSSPTTCLTHGPFPSATTYYQRIAPSRSKSDQCFDNFVLHSPRYPASALSFSHTVFPYYFSWPHLIRLICFKFQCRNTGWIFKLVDRGCSTETDRRLQVSRSWGGAGWPSSETGHRGPWWGSEPLGLDSSRRAGRARTRTAPPMARTRLRDDGDVTPSIFGPPSS